MVLCPETPEGSTGSCSGFKVSQKTGNSLSLIRQTGRGVKITKLKDSS